MAFRTNGWRAGHNQRTAAVARMATEYPKAVTTLETAIRLQQGDRRRKGQTQAVDSRNPPVAAESLLR
jgi:hypothetical protein